MITDKTAILDLVRGLRFYNVHHAVICPGSRNAPIINELIREQDIQTYSIVDERSAGFFAIGIAKMVNAPVAIVCTSGTAALNFAPAVAEALYQRVPLLVLTADRPHEWINQGDSQSIIQKDVYGANINSSFELLQHVNDNISKAHNHRIISEALISLNHPQKGPVHINIPLPEPLYEEGSDDQERIPFLTYHDTHTVLQDKVIEHTKQSLTSNKIMIVVGMNDNSELREQLEQFAMAFDAVVMHESTSNVNSTLLFGCIDRLFSNMSEDLIPNVLITMGGPLISRKIKMMLRKEDIEHWHVDSSKWISDDYLHQTQSFAVSPLSFLKQLCAVADKDTNASFRSLWIQHNQQISRKHNEFLSDVPFSDLKAMELILKSLPTDSVLHLGNSTVVRYAQLFEDGRHVLHYGNRGTSGIEGSVSTAVGAAANATNLHVCIVGDLSFMYDINALWNNYIKNNLRIVVINNSGGGIFRFIEGPNKIAQNETYIEASHNMNMQHLAKHFDLDYERCEDLKTLSTVLPKFIETSPKKSRILEIITPQEINASILKKYFNLLNQ